MRPLLPAFVFGGLLVIGTLRLSASRSAPAPHLSAATIVLTVAFIIATLVWRARNS